MDHCSEPACLNIIEDQNTGRGRRKTRCRPCQEQSNKENQKRHYELKGIRDYLAGKVPHVEIVELRPLIDWPEDLFESTGQFEHHFHESGTGIDQGCFEG